MDARHLLSKVSFLLVDDATALELTWQTLKEAQAYETTRVIERLYRLLGRIFSARGDYDQADAYFEQAIQLCKERSFRMDYARALYYYGTSLVQRSTVVDGAFAAREVISQNGLEYLHEARTVFADCHASVDLQQVEHLLAQHEKSSTLKQ